MKIGQRSRPSTRVRAVRIAIVGLEARTQDLALKHGELMAQHTDSTSLARSVRLRSTNRSITSRTRR